MNSKFLQPFLKLRKLYEYCCEAEEFALTKPNISATSARKGMEFIVKMIYASNVTAYDTGVTVFEMITDVRFVAYINDTVVINTLHYLRKMGNIEQLLAMMPGVKPGAIKEMNIDEAQMARTEAIILSMTQRERNHPEIINGSRRKRIAAGSGTSVEDVNRLLRQFDQTKKMMKQFSDMEKKGGRGMFGLGKGKMKFPF